jgi:hypothetical protein
VVFPLLCSLLDPSACYSTFLGRHCDVYLVDSADSLKFTLEFRGTQERLTEKLGFLVSGPWMAKNQGCKGHSSFYFFSCGAGKPSASHIC